jgi:hypothetical protein
MATTQNLEEIRQINIQRCFKNFAYVKVLLEYGSNDNNKSGNDKNSYNNYSNV